MAAKPGSGAPGAEHPSPGASANDLPRATARGPVPEQLPDLTLFDGQGKPHRLSEWRGHPLLVNFWATWCEPCRREIPLLKSLRHREATQGLQVVGIAVDFRDAVLQYAQTMAIDYPILIGEQGGLEAIDSFGMEAVFPFTVFADGQGRIVALKVGELHADEADFIVARVRDVEAGRIALAEARRQISKGMSELAVERAKRSAGAG